MNEWYKLKVKGLSDSNIRILLGVTKTYSEIFTLTREQFTLYLNFNDEIIDKIMSSEQIDLELEQKKLEENKVKVLFIQDEEYPESLKNIGTPPLFLYYKGNIELLKEFIIGVVGTRNATCYGRVACEKFTLGLVEAGIVTVSGLALGIDTICHKKTLLEKGKTIAIVGSGLDVIYPKENRSLWEEIAKEGLLISEYPLGTQPQQYHFPMRNRIIAGISNGILVVESKKKGGSLITASIAVEEGKDVFAVPGEIFSDFSQGCNDLIKNSQAKLVVKVEDILEEYGIKISVLNKKSKLELSKLEKEVYETLNTNKSLDEILIEVKGKTSEVLATLVDLEIKGLVVATLGGCYMKKK
ncbi:MAG: DNA-processing protein DprA [Fusobacteriaceae bacterium]